MENNGKSTSALKKTSASKKKNAAPKPLSLLVTVVNRNKAEFFLDYLLEFEVNMQVSSYGMGTAESAMLDYLGLSGSDKQVIFSLIRQDRVKDAMNGLEEKFAQVRGGKGIAFSIPLASVSGVAIYQFLSNFRKNREVVGGQEE